MDIIVSLNFYNYLSDVDYINLLITCKDYFCLINDDLYRNIIQSKFSKKFTINAKSIIINWKDCYNRIKRFEYLTSKYNVDLWCENDYYAYWKYIKKKLSREEFYRQAYANSYLNIKNII